MLDSDNVITVDGGKNSLLVSLLVVTSSTNILLIIGVLLSISILTPSTPKILSWSCLKLTTFGNELLVKLYPSNNLTLADFVSPILELEVLNVYSFGNSIFCFSPIISEPFLLTVGFT